MRCQYWQRWSLWAAFPWCLCEQQGQWDVIDFAEIKGSELTLDAIGGLADLE